jgi:serine/threonine protein kinase
MIHLLLDNRFRIEGSLARSAHSELFQGTDAKTGRQVAIKLVRPRFMAGDAFGARLKQEFELLRQLEHPNVVQVLEVGRTGDGMVYFAMELIAGRTLAQVIREEGPLPSTRVAPLLNQAAAALDAAHGLHIVHRDITADNLMLFADAKGAEAVKILDFGTAKLLEGKPDPNDALRTGAVVLQGSAAYMSPEQAAGNAVNHLTDVYSLGVVLFHALTGKLPFEGRSDIDVLIGHVNQPVPTFADRNPEDRTPHTIEQAVLTALQKRPSDRPQTAGAFAAIFQEALAGRNSAAAGFAAAAKAGGRTGVATQRLGAPVARNTVPTTLLRPIAKNQNGRPPSQSAVKTSMRKSEATALAQAWRLEELNPARPEKGVSWAAVLGVLLLACVLCLAVLLRG